MHNLNLAGLSLITPNRKETFELAGIDDNTRHTDPFKDTDLLAAAEKLLQEMHPALLLITLGEQGMLLCQRNKKPFHIPEALYRYRIRPGSMTADDERIKQGWKELKELWPAAALAKFGPLP